MTLLGADPAKLSGRNSRTQCQALFRTMSRTAVSDHVPDKLARKHCQKISRTSQVCQPEFAHLILAAPQIQGRFKIGP